MSARHRGTLSSRPLARLLYFYPFTPAGSVLLAASLALFATGLARRNPYGLFLSFVGLSVLAVLAAAGRLQAQGAGRSTFQWDSSTPLVARRPEVELAIHGDPLRLAPFFRIHFHLSGTLTAGRGAPVHLSREVSFAATAVAAMPLYLPLCGPFTCRGRFAVRDLFGLTRARFGQTQERTLMVLPASWTPKGVPPIQPSVGMEEKSRRRSSDEERYYMREYMPGDRFRDINWKVSQRLSELITRISPPAQERSTLLEVAFRNYRDPRPESVESVAHLNVLKSWLLSFLRRMKADHPEVQFRLRTASRTVVLTGEEEIDRFAWELAGEHYASGEMPVVEDGGGQLFVFSTPFDRGLSRYLAAHPREQVHLFRTASAGAEEKPLRLFPEVLDALPGPWIFRREKLSPAAVIVPPRGSATEERFAVRVF